MDEKAKAPFNQFKLNSLRSLLEAGFLAVLLTACSNSAGFQTGGSSNASGNSSQSPSSPTTTPAPSQNNSVFSSNYNPIALTWESSSHPERAAWSTTLYGIISEHFNVLDAAKDIIDFCPSYTSLTKDQKINLWADLFASDAYYESGWDPTENSTDAGTARDKNTWSVGLLQMSVVDQQNHNLSYGYTFADLQTPGPNLELGVSVMAQQITKYGTVLIDKGSPGLYWSTMDPGGQYDASSRIEATTKALSFCH